MNGLRFLKIGAVAIILLLTLGPYLLFTRDAEALPENPVSFSLPDAYGRIVSSQDYAGVPVFLEFGGCW